MLPRTALLSRCSGECHATDPAISSGGKSTLQGAVETFTLMVDDYTSDETKVQDHR